MRQRSSVKREIVNVSLPIRYADRKDPYKHTKCESCIVTLTTHESLSSHPDDTGVHQFLDLGTNAWVLQVLLQSRRVVLSLLKNGLHNRIL